jgi:hypothetical protein
MTLIFVAGFAAGVPVAPAESFASLSALMVCVCIHVIRVDASHLIESPPLLPAADRNAPG